MELGNQIKKYRLELQISQEQLADRIYVSRQTISNWELEETSPNPQQLKLLSKFLDVSVNELLDDVESINEKNGKYENTFKHFNIVFYLDLCIAIVWGITAIVNVIYGNYEATLINLVLFFVWILIAILIYNKKLKK